MRLHGLYQQDTRRLTFYPTCWLDNSTTWNPASLGAGESTSVVINFTDAKMGDFVWASLSTDAQNLSLNAIVSSTSDVTCVLINGTSAVVNLADSTLYTRIFKK